MTQAEDFTKYWRNKIQGSTAELDLMEKLIQFGIEPRYGGETTAVDVFAKTKEKLVLIQVKSTRDNSRVIERDDIISLLRDALYFATYPLFDIAFFTNEIPEHYFIPVEELVSRISQKTVSVSKNRIRKFNRLDFETFQKRMKECTFPIMRFDQSQFESWIDALLQ